MLTDRELAILIWLVIVILICLVILRKSLFSPLISLVKALWAVLLMPFAIIVNCYIALIFCVLWYYNILETDLLITFTLWILLFLYPSINTVYSKHSTLSIDDFVKSSLSLNIIFIFLVNKYTFPLWLELILVPTLFFLGAMSEFSKNKIEYRIANKLSNCLIIGFGVVMILNVVVQFILNIEDLTTSIFWKSFTIELYVLLHLPLLYFVKYYAYYEKFKIHFSFKTYFQLSGIKIHLFTAKILFKTKFNVVSLNTIWDGIRKNNFRSKEEILRSIEHED
ncbi:hypothetical protein [Sporosarcina sp. YIM B06819]|uniref:hypothetical protein n=1 Tax=Sporosarcina sp. YIM B06819 TaxID=3081769 RepID=UPI00298C0CF4|nr:hypothetical protein [Sporosarcina sp. YIM B06819]